MIQVEIWHSKVDGAYDIRLFRYQSQVEGYQTLRYRLVYGIQELSDLTRRAVFDHLPGFLAHQLESSGKMG